jgi:putative transposase
MIENNLNISISEQCIMLDLPRSTYYNSSQGESPENLEYMRRIDELYLDFPAWGSRLMRDRLRLEYSDRKINRKRVQRLMRLMGIDPIYPKKKLSRPNSDNKKYPYLLRDLTIDKPNLVWCTDITYIRLKYGFTYLVAILDWFSRKVLSWELSNTFDSYFCISALNAALDIYGRPEIFNSDQGSQFTSKDFTSVLKENKIRISMDGKGRALDNVVVERFWRTLKYEEVYLKDYLNMVECKNGLGNYIDRYNDFRPHSSLGGITPDMAYGGYEIKLIS